jgi:hypothetical protein
MTSGAGSALAGLRVSEGLDAGANVQFGRIGSGAFNGYTWTVIAGGSGDGLPSGVSNGQWLRVVRKSTTITAFRAPDSGGSPGTWIQVGQPQTIIMTTPVWVGFYINNATGVGLNTATFSGLSIQPLNKAPIIGVTSVTSPVVASTPISGTVTDDGYPVPVSLTRQWTTASSPGISILNALNLSTTATITGDGLHTLRLVGDDSSTRSFADLSFTGYVSNFSQWQATSFTGNSDPAAAADPDNDGLPNLLEYAIGTSGSSGNTNPITHATVPVSSEQYLSITVPKNPAATDVTYTVEATGDLANPLSWSSVGLVTITNTSTILQVRDNVPISSGQRRFMRVRVTHF